MKEKYSFQKYVYSDRWISYWHQINEVLRFDPESVLIIGKGDGIVEDVLRKVVSQVLTLDCEKAFEPDIIASVEEIPLENNSYDMVLCAEVLEHLPFEKFEKALVELKRVVKNNVVLSLPHFGPPLKFSLKIPFIREIKIALKIPFPLKHRFRSEHYWEIGKRGYSPAKIRKIISRRFRIVKEFMPFENQYHHFYILKK